MSLSLCGNWERNKGGHPVRSTKNDATRGATGVAQGWQGEEVEGC